MITQMLRPPDHYAISIERGVERKEIVVGNIARVLRRSHYYYAAMLLQMDAPMPDGFVRAVRIHSSPVKREIVEAFIIARADDNTFRDILLMDREIIANYKELFFDMSVFEDRLDIDDYVRTYSDAHGGSAWGQEIKTAAIDMGLEYLKVKYSHGTYDVPPAIALRASITQGYMLSRAAQMVGIDSNVAREARGWMTTLGKNITILPDVREETANKALDLRIALTQDTSETGTQQKSIENIDPSLIITE